MLRSVRPQKLHRNLPGSLLASHNNAAARLLLMLPVDAHVINVRSSEQLSPVIRKDSQCHLLGRGTPFLASVRLTLADEKLWKENVIMADPLHYRRGNYRVKWFGPDQRRDKGSISEDVHPHLLIRKPLVHQAFCLCGLTFSAGRACASNCDFWAAWIAPANPVNISTVRQCLHM